MPIGSALTFELPPAPGVHQGWRRAFDTFLEPPQDICDSPDAAPVVDETYPVQPRSLVLLFAGRLPGTGQGGPCPDDNTSGRNDNTSGRNDKDFGGDHERSF